MKFGENLYNLRKKEKISQEKLAEKLGVSRQSVSKWETGESYPEMNRILKLCKIFHCQLNDLVNDKILDFDSLDEEIKMNVVKFKKEEQKRMKGLSKAIQVIAKIGKVSCVTMIPIIILVMIFIPLFINNINIEELNQILNSTNEMVEIAETDLKELFDNSFVENEVNSVETLKSYSKADIILGLEIGVLSVLIILVLMASILKHLEMLFKNINEGNTPFTLENVGHVSKIAWFMIATILIENISTLIYTNIINTNISSGIEMFDLIEILFVFSMSYIFKYGHQLQVDSNAIMYGDEKE